jgi:hypothetical protein
VCRGPTGNGRALEVLDAGPRPGRAASTEPRASPAKPPPERQRELAVRAPTTHI